MFTNVPALQSMLELFSQEMLVRSLIQNIQTKSLMERLWLANDITRVFQTKQSVSGLISKVWLAVNNIVSSGAVVPRLS